MIAAGEGARAAFKWLGRERRCGVGRGLALTACALLAGEALGAAESSASAESDRAASDMDEVVVVPPTGTHIRRQEDLPSSGDAESVEPDVAEGLLEPLTQFSADALRTQGIKDIRDLVDLLPINYGAENNSDNLTQNFTVGTANLNLRGLGVASTLVLLNGKRQVHAAVQTDDGYNFVDLAALVPVLALERVEIFKDGASAVYGSDAVAGVANFITRRGFDGAEMQVEYRARTNNGSQDDLNIDGVVGGAMGEGGSFLMAASYLRRTSLVLGEVDWLRPATSGFGNPGSFNVPSLNRVVADPECTAKGGLLQELANGGTICRFDYGPQITAVPVEDRLQGYARAEWPLTDATGVWAEVGYARNDISREVSPSFPVLNTPIVPANNPGNIFGEDVYFEGRPFGVGQPTEINYYHHNTVRVSFGIEGELNNGFVWDLSFTRAANDAVLNPRDVIAANFQAALRGFGGSGCDTSPTAATPAVPGEGACRFFNPFSSAFDALPGDPTFNDPSLRSFIIGDYLGDAKSELMVLDIDLTGFFGDFRGGPGGFAVGAKVREESVATVFDSITQQDGFAFLIGNPNFAGKTHVHATYGEVTLPFRPWLEVTGALRLEHYVRRVGTTLDPKLTVLVSPSPSLSLRAALGTSFRAPSTFQTHGVQTHFVNILDHDGTRTFAGRRTIGNADLSPETSTAFNVGATWRQATGLIFGAPFLGYELGVDYWRYAFEDVLHKDAAQAIVDADPIDARIERTSAGTISIVNVTFVNADAIDTSGIDFTARGEFASDWGAFAPFVVGSLILDYDVTNAGRRIDALGRLNRANVGAPNQRFKVNVGADLQRGALSVNAQLRHIGGYEDDGGMEIDAFTTLDANIAIDIGERVPGFSATAIRLGVINATDEAPPFVNIAGSYDVRSADPRGRRVFLRLEMSN